MSIPFDKLVSTIKLGMSVQGDVDTSVRVAVFVDEGATPFLIDTIRDAFVPQTTAALVRVARLNEGSVTVKPDTDVALVLSCGSEHLQECAQSIVIAGVPTVIVSESSVEVPFIQHDNRMLGLIAATDRVHLLDTLARWILDRTEKATAFAANFPFMRIAAANRIITSAALGNAATGALFFIPGADFPVMTAAQMGMMLQLAAIFGKPVRFERAYEAAALLAAAVAMRAVTRELVKHAGYAGFAVKALVGGAGTYGMGRALCELYGHDIDYTRANEIVRAGYARIKDIASIIMNAHEGEAASISVVRAEQ